MPKIFGAKNLSADDIAGISGVINDAGTTGGTSTAYTATLASRPNPLTNGYTFVCVFNVTNGASATIALSSGTAQPIWTNGEAAPAGAIIAGTPYVCRSDGTRVHLVGTLGVLGATKFPAGIKTDTGIYTESNADSLYLVGGTTWGANIQIECSGTGGDISYYVENGATAPKHKFYDKSDVIQLTIDENGTTCSSYLRSNAITSPLGALTLYSGSANGSTIISGGNLTGNNTGSESRHWGTGGTYPGAHQQFAPLSTRAASTAIALCPVATGDTAKVEISETTIADCLTFVDAAGTVTLYDKLGGTVSASIVNSSSPAAGEYGVYISAGVLYFKGGSSYAGKMGSFSKVWKA